MPINLCWNFLKAFTIRAVPRVNGTLSGPLGAGRSGHACGYDHIRGDRPVRHENEAGSSCIVLGFTRERGLCKAAYSRLFRRIDAILREDSGRVRKGVQRPRSWRY